MRDDADQLPAALHTVEVSHGKPRLVGPRPSDLGSVPTDIDRNRDHDARGRFKPANQAAVGRGARAALRAPYRAAAQRISSATADGCEPDVADQLLSDALAVHRSARTELGTRSVFVEGPCIAYAVESVLAGFYMQEAVKAGLLTERGLELHARAMQCETQASRAMTAALAATKALAARRKRSADPHRALLEAFGTPKGDGG